MILGAAPRLAETITQRAHVLDALIDPAFFGSAAGQARRSKRLAATLAEARSFEDVLRSRPHLRAGAAFLIGVRVLAGTMGARQRRLRATATSPRSLVAALLDARAARVRGGARHDRRAAQVALIAMGRLGGREMTAASDLDLAAPLRLRRRRQHSSDGKRPLPAGTTSRA